LRREGRLLWSIIGAFLATQISIIWLAAHAAATPAAARLKTGVTPTGR
jgi:hypothetical protein